MSTLTVESHRPYVRRAWPGEAVPDSSVHGRLTSAKRTRWHPTSAQALTVRAWIVWGMSTRNTDPTLGAYEYNAGSERERGRWWSEISDAGEGIAGCTNTVC